MPPLLFYKVQYFQELKLMQRRLELQGQDTKALSHWLLDAWPPTLRGEAQSLNIYEFCWFQGVQLIQDGEILKRFLVSISGLQPALNEDVLLELTLQYIKLECFVEALDRLFIYMPLHPYQDDSCLLGFTGVICHALLKREDTTSHVSSGIDYLKKSLAIDPFNPLFLSCAVELMKSNLDLDSLCEWLEELCDRTNGDYFVLLLRFQILKVHFPEMEQAWVDIALQLFLIDPIWDQGILLELAALKTVSRVVVCNLMACWIEYDKSAPFIWTQMVGIFAELSPDEMEQVWMDRIDWWPNYLDYNNLEEMFNDSDDNVRKWADAMTCILVSSP